MVRIGSSEGSESFFSILITVMVQLCFAKKIVYCAWLHSTTALLVIHRLIGIPELLRES